jgi:hypothetical protein
VIAAVVGALLGAGALIAAYSRDPGLTFEMDAAPPAFVTGVYASERDASGTFAWTSDRVLVDLRDLDRHAPWSCTLRFRGPRPEGLPPPEVEVFVDATKVASVLAPAEYLDLGFNVPAGGKSLQLTMNVSPTFTPKTADTRRLGVQIDRLQCRPSAMAWPPRWPLMRTAFASAFAAVMFVLMGLSLGPALLSSAALAIGAAVMLTTAAAVYGDYSNTIANLTAWIALLTGVFMSSAERVAGRRFTPAARAVFVISAVALILKLFGLMHPAKPDIDAVFHAHRLAAVVAGNYYFTQPFVGGVQMPYAIGLYVFAWPWTWLVSDYVALIRTVAAASDVVAGALLYPVLVRAWGDRKTAVLAVLFYQLAPLGYAVLGNANLTNLFGQSVALVVVAAAVSWNLDVRRPVTVAAFTGLVAWAFCSHVSTITTLLATLGVVVLLYWWRGDTIRKRAAVSIVVAAVPALAASWFIYYRHFSGDIAAAFDRMFSGGTAANAATAAEAARGFMGTTDRVKDLMLQAVSSAGWPMVVLAAIGVWVLWRRRVRDRLVSAMLAWAAVWTVLSASTVFSKVDQEFVRYTAEFLGRINLATIPLVAILAAMGASAGWNDQTPSGARTPLRAVAVVLIGWSIWIAWNSLVGWFSR